MTKQLSLMIILIGILTNIIILIIFNNIINIKFNNIYLIYYRYQENCLNIYNNINTIETSKFRV